MPEPAAPGPRDADESPREPGAMPRGEAEECPVCGSTTLDEIRCKTICRNCHTIVRSCADL